jgi:hypothetical protein
MHRHTRRVFLVASGDLVHGFFLATGDGYPRQWPTTLRSLGELEFEKVLGGHGCAQHTCEPLGQFRAYLEELDEVVSRAKQSGVPLDRVQETATPSSLNSLAGGYDDYLAGKANRHDFRVHLNTAAEVMARGVRDKSQPSIQTSIRRSLWNPSTTSTGVTS